MKANGLKWTKDIYRADYIIINTCGFIKDAKQESINLILQISQVKKSNKNVKIIVMGCLVQRYFEPLKNQLKDVDALFGVNSAEEIKNFISGERVTKSIPKRFLLTPNHYAYIKISEGCNHKCSFCAIPFIKGPYKSKSIEEIVNEVSDLYNRGVKEFNIIGQDTTYYGYDIYKQRCLSELLKKLAIVVDEGWIRLLYTYPTNFPFDVLNVISEYESICKYIDIPLQHISNKILKSMKRGISKKEIYYLLDKIRNIIPKVAIRSTFIVGFPNENKKDFDELHSFIKEQELDRVGVFTYSHEDNTIAYQLSDDVPKELKEERKNIILKTQAEISYKKNKNKINSIMKVLVDNFDKRFIYCRSEHDAPDIDNRIVIPKYKNIKRGSFLNVKIKEATDYDLYGEIYE